MDFSDDSAGEYEINIFSKEVFSPNEIYDKILNDRSSVTHDEITLLDDYVSAVPVNNIEDLRNIVLFYSDNYQRNSMNWLNVSEITQMVSLFQHTRYTGSISKWDVSNCTSMKACFYGGNLYSTMT